MKKLDDELNDIEIDIVDGSCGFLEEILDKNVKIKI